MPNGQLSDGRQAAHHASTGDTSRAAQRIKQRACIDRSADASRTIEHVPPSKVRLYRSEGENVREHHPALRAAAYGDENALCIRTRRMANNVATTFAMARPFTEIQRDSGPNRSEIAKCDRSSA
ncbi:hypothetical protein [Burkholderia multivorans]|uniref:hypothetical protein n=1 Tax=Burkholderia multivorans TaxID=87883 RepID=UPI0015E3D13D|nr:hypothetical protein [Burkholderia multivorans]